MNATTRSIGLLTATVVVGFAGGCSSATSTPAAPAGNRYVDAPIEHLEWHVVHSDDFDNYRATNEAFVVVTSIMPSTCSIFGRADASRKGSDEFRVRISNLVPIEFATTCSDVHRTRVTSVSLGKDLVRGREYTVRVNGEVLTFTFMAP